MNFFYIFTYFRLKENMIQLSKKVEAFGDPLDKSIWLLEHIMETNGADHLKLDSRHLNIFQYLCLDVLLVLVCVIILFILLLDEMFAIFIYCFLTKSKLKTGC